MPRKLLILLFCVFATHIGRGQIITTIAGTGATIFNGDSIAATAANIYHPEAVIVDTLGNIYIAEEGNHRVRKINSFGTISTFAGTGIAGFSGDNGPATLAKLNSPTALAFDLNGNIFIADNYNHVIRMVNTVGTIYTIVGNGIAGFNGDNILATDAKISNCVGIAVDKTGNLFFSDLDNNRIRRISSDGKITTIAGTGNAGNLGNGGPATAAELDQPFGLVINSDSNIYFADYGNHSIRKISNDGTITTIAGNGTFGCSGNDISATMAQLKFPFGVAIDNQNNILLSDASCMKVKTIDQFAFILDIAGTGLNGFTGDGGLAINAELRSPGNIYIDAKNNIYIADWGNNRIRLIKNTVGIYSINDFSNVFSAYPNPSNGIITVSVKSAIAEPIKLSVSNLLGQVISEFTITTNRDNETNLDVPDGLYFLSANTPTGRISQKILVFH